MRTRRRMRRMTSASHVVEAAAGPPERDCTRFGSGRLGYAEFSLGWCVFRESFVNGQ